MKKIRYGLIVMSMVFCWTASAVAEISIGIGLPSVSIGINLPLFPHLVRVPGYPVYYAPQMDANYFFYDGMYWVYQDDYWYASTWYNGPWSLVEPEIVPLFILRIPVRYYRQPPVYFRGWQPNAPPRWGQHWGHEWERHRRGWDKWKRSSVPAPAPLPVYQRKYSGDRYPGVEQQPVLRSKSYRYQPRDKAVRQHFKQQTPAALQRAPEPARRIRQEAPPVKGQNRQDIRHPAPYEQVAPPASHRPPQKGDENMRNSTPYPPPLQQRAPAVRDQHQQAPVMTDQEQRGRSRRDSREDSYRERGRDEDRGRGREQRNDDDRGRGRDR